jgi:putative DNA primase/helicase
MGESAPDPFAPLSPGERPRPLPHPSSTNRKNAVKDTQPFARAIWRESVPAAGTLVEAYLRSRGLVLPRRAPLRFHPECRRGEERLPAMIALMTNPATGEPCGIHRTFLRPDGSGKAVGQAKMMLGDAGVIRLVPDEEVTYGLGLAEGIETALSVMQGAGWSPVWACGSAGAISAFPALPGIEALTIFADADAAGDKAARSCAERWVEGGKEVTIHRASEGRDWNDIGKAA